MIANYRSSSCVNHIACILFSAFTPSLTEVVGAPVLTTTQDKTLYPLHPQAEAACQATAVCSPTSVRSPLFRQRRVTCFEDELSDDEDSNNAVNTGPKPDSDDVTATSPLNIDGDNKDGADLQSCVSNNVTTPHHTSFIECEEGFANKTALPGSESPIMTIHCPFDHKEAVAGSISLGSSKLTIGIEPHTHQDDGQLESKRSPKLEHKAVTRVKSMMSIEAPNLLLQQKPNVDEASPSLAPAQCGRNPVTAGGLLTHQLYKTGDASELLGVCTIDTVTLKRNEDESFGLDLEIISSPLKVVISGLRLGGAAERVCPIGLLLLPSRYQ